MEERKAVVREYVAKGVKVAYASKLIGISKSTYYYKPRGGKPGRKPSTFTNLLNGNIVPDENIVDKIKSVLENDFMEYGYRKVSWDLKDQGIIIGKEKTYRLMKENHLLLKANKKSPRTFVRFTQPLPLLPFEKLEMDIKFIYIRANVSEQIKKSLEQFFQLKNIQVYSC